MIRWVLSARCTLPTPQRIVLLALWQAQVDGGLQRKMPREALSDATGLCVRAVDAALAQLLAQRLIARIARSRYIVKSYPQGEVAAESYPQGEGGEMAVDNCQNPALNAGSADKSGISCTRYSYVTKANGGDAEKLSRLPALPGGVDWILRERGVTIKPERLDLVGRQAAQWQMMPWIGVQLLADLVEYYGSTRFGAASMWSERAMREGVALLRDEFTAAGGGDAGLAACGRIMKSAMGQNSSGKSWSRLYPLTRKK